MTGAPLRWARRPFDPVDLGASYDTDTITITVDGTPTIITIDTGAMSDSDEVIAAIDAIAGITAGLNGLNQLVISGDTPSVDFSIAYSDAGIGTDLGSAAATFNPSGTAQWELFYLENSTATGTDVAWRNAGVTYEFNASGQMISGPRSLR